MSLESCNRINEMRIYFIDSPTELYNWCTDYYQCVHLMEVDTISRDQQPATLEVICRETPLPTSWETQWKIQMSFPTGIYYVNVGLGEWSR